VTRRILLFVVALAAGLAAGAIPAAVGVVTWLRGFLEFFAGVFTLVGLTGVVVFGLLASARYTPIRLRILAQGAHRGAAVASMSCLVAHIVLKEMERHAPPVAVVLPISVNYWVGLGVIASDLMIVVFVTGVIRGRFIRSSNSWVWRAIHLNAYLCWPIAIAHGLLAGRPAKGWVTLSYLACLGLVAVFGLIRLALTVRARRAVRPRPVVRQAPREPAPLQVPDERFWSELKAEIRR
jgi:hypothetical protein